VEGNSDGSRALSRRTPSAGSSLLAMILFEKFGQHQPMNRQIELWPRTPLANQVGARAVPASSTEASTTSPGRKPSTGLNIGSSGRQSGK
jgi:hypothetical protein